jgi:hypothetical protein
VTPRHDAPPSLLRNRPVSVPAKTVPTGRRKAAKAVGGVGRAELSGCQEAPPSVLRNNPGSPPIYSRLRFAGSTARDRIRCWPAGKPRFIGFQWAPASVLLNTTPGCAMTYTTDGREGSTATPVNVEDARVRLHDSPALTLLKTPWKLAA